MATHRYLFLSILNVASITCQIVKNLTKKTGEPSASMQAHTHTHKFENDSDEQKTRAHTHIFIGMDNVIVIVDVI